MNRDSYKKQLIKQKIQAHRDISRLELEALRTNNPVASAFSMGASVSSLLGGRGSTVLKSTTAAAIPALILGLVHLWRRRSGRGGSGDGNA